MSPDIAPSLPRSVVFFRLNDVYHIDAKSDYLNSRSLIFPRLATLLKRAREYLAVTDTPAYLCVPGDFLAPSCLSKETYGAHMVDLLNALGTAFVTFGNHEFEIVQINAPCSAAKVRSMARYPLTRRGAGLTPCSGAARC